MQQKRDVISAVAAERERRSDDLHAVVDPKLTMKFLEELKLPFDQIIFDEVTHSNPEFYAQLKVTTLKFHAESFRLVAER